MSVTTGMVGHGAYNRHSAAQMKSIEHVAPWLDEAVADMALAETPATLGLADFGCSEGRNSIAVMRRLVAALRARTSRPIQTIHSDLPTNDYGELMRGLRPDGRSVFEAEEVYAAAVGGSMFDRLLPPGSLHLATTFNAIGFLSRRPVDRLPGFILANGPSQRGGVGQVSDADRRAVARQARDDVESFMTARAAELVPGGKLLIQVFGAGETLRTCDGIYDVLNDALLEVVDAGLIDRDGYEAFYQPVYMRTLDELTAPLTDGTSPCGKLFRLDRAETYEVPVPFVEDFRRGGDVEAYAAEYTDFYRVFTEPVLRMEFAAHRDLDGLIDDVYRRAQRLVRGDPDRYEFHYIAVAALMTRV
jgi:gibberellin A4 carboxyl methyltransferase